MTLLARVADGATLVLFGMAAWTIASGGTRAGIFQLVPPVGAVPLLYAAAALMLVRHIARPVPSAIERWRAGWRRVSDSPSWGPVVRAFLATRVTVFVVSLLAVLTFGLSKPGFVIDPDPMTNLPARFDAGYYGSIAIHGYDRDGVLDRQRNIAFFPAMPMLMRAAGPAFGATDPDVIRQRRMARMLWAGTVVSLCAFLAALWYLLRLGTLLVGEQPAANAVLLLACYPFACFFSAPYTESLFLLTATATAYHFQRGQHAGTVAWGFLAGLTRPNGFMLAVPLALLALDRWRTGRHEGAAHRFALVSLTTAMAPVAGMLAFTVYLYAHIGIWFAWSRNHAAWGRTFSVEPLQRGFAALRNEGLLPALAAAPYDALNATAAAFALVMIWPVYRRLGLAWAVFVAITVVPPLFFGGALSAGRLTSTVFPVFLALGAILPPRAVRSWAVAFALLQGVCAALFFTWRELF